MDNKGKKLVVKLNDTLNIVVDVMKVDNFPEEIFVGIENKDGLYLQDIACVRPEYELDREGNCKISDKEVDCIVWSDANDEDYTHKFKIPAVEE